MCTIVLRSYGMFVTGLGLPSFFMLTFNKAFLAFERTSMLKLQRNCSVDGFSNVVWLNEVVLIVHDSDCSFLAPKNLL